MCGIGGIVGPVWGSPSRDERLEAMRQRLRHRGPDGSGVFGDDGCGLVHTRLALLDESGGRQPFRSPDGRFTLVYNGEIYNYAELRRRLAPDWSFRTRSDAEVVLAAFSVLGERCPEILDGMFAFFVWDGTESRGFAARDRLGVKPFVYAMETDEAGGRLVFASEAKAILAARPGPPRVCRESLLEVLVAPCFSGVERPAFEGLSYLPPGHRLRIDREGLRVERWGDHELASTCEESGDQLATELGEALDVAVRGALEADHPVGLFLSGGLDSTVLAGLARRAGAHPPAFSIAFQDHDRFDYARSLIVNSDDAPFARLAADEMGLEHEVVPARRCAEDLRQLAQQNDALPAWEQELAQHHLARTAARRVKAVLVGDAADETHYGYHFLLDPVATERPRRILERFAGPAADLVRPDVLDRPLDHFEEKYRNLVRDAGHDDRSPLARTLGTTWLIVHRWLPRLLHNGDIHTMAHSLEARVPFAAETVLQVARRVPPSIALEGGVEKALLRRASRGLIPEVIRLRRKSALPKDQGPGIARFYQDQVRPMIDRLGSLLDPDRLASLCAADVLDEGERALLFRLAGLGYFAEAHGVEI